MNIALVGSGPGAATQKPASSDAEIAGGRSVGQTGRTAPAGIVVGADPFEVVIRQGDRELVRSAEGIVVAVWQPDGDLMRTFVLQAADQFQVPVAAGPLSAYKLRGSWMRERIAADTWADVSRSFQSGSVMLRVASGEQLVLYLGDDAPMAPKCSTHRTARGGIVSSGTTLAAESKRLPRSSTEAWRADRPRRKGDMPRIRLTPLTPQRQCIWRSAASRGTPSVA